MNELAFKWTWNLPSLSQGEDESQVYFWQISGKSQENLGKISNVYWKDLGKISSKFRENLGKILSKSQGNLRQISGKSWANLEQISGRSRTNLGQIPGTYWATHGQIFGQSQASKCKCDFTHLVVPRTCFLTNRKIVHAEKCDKNKIKCLNWLSYEHGNW